MSEHNLFYYKVLKYIQLHQSSLVINFQKHHLWDIHVTNLHSFLFNIKPESSLFAAWNQYSVERKLLNHSIVKFELPSTLVVGFN